MYTADLNYYVSIAENSTHKKRVNRDKCNFATKKRMFGVLAIVEILHYRGFPIPESRTLSHPVPNVGDLLKCTLRFKGIFQGPRPGEIFMLKGN